MDAAHCEGCRGRARNRGEAPVVEIDGDGAVAVAGKTTRWRGCEGLQLEPKVVGDADEVNGAAEHNLTGRGRLRPWERR